MTVVRLPESLHARLQRQADEENRSLANMVVRSIALHIASVDKSV